MKKTAKGIVVILAAVMFVLCFSTQGSAKVNNRAKKLTKEFTNYAAYMAVDQALESVRNHKIGAVPNHLRDAHYKGAAKLGHGIGYKYAHDYPDHYVKQQYLPDELLGTTFYEPTENGYEKNIKEYLERIRK